jgi:hypothetical protein
MRGLRIYTHALTYKATGGVYVRDDKYNCPQRPFKSARQERGPGREHFSQQRRDRRSRYLPSLPAPGGSASDRTYRVLVCRDLSDVPCLPQGRPLQLSALGVADDSRLRRCDRRSGLRILCYRRTRPASRTTRPRLGGATAGRIRLASRFRSAGPPRANDRQVRGDCGRARTTRGDHPASSQAMGRRRSAARSPSGATTGADHAG